VSDEAIPRTRYARSGELGIAYQELGSGPIDLVLVPQITSHVELMHEIPGYTRYLQGLASFARVVTFDKRGTGMSDRTEGVALLEERIDDLVAVMDAVGIERAAIVGQSEGGTLGVMMAAQHPERVSHLVLLGTAAWYIGDVDEGAFMDAATEAALRPVILDQWGTGTFVQLLAPTLAAQPGTEEVCSRLERYSTGPHGMQLLWEWTRAIDVRPLLPSVRVPTLVLRRADEIAPRRASQYLAEHIPGARYEEVPGIDHLPWIGDGRSVVATIEEFVTGTRTSEVVTDESILATVLFADIVRSTEQAATLGDREWRRVLDAHDAGALDEVAKFRGRVVKTTGDGLLASFDGPARAIRCAQALHDAARALDLEIRAGVHTGECEQRGDDLAGITVHIGARVAALATSGEVLVTSTVRDLVFGAGFQFEDRGVQELRGVPGAWQVLAVVG
jgi:pimeloyl-ACP methyl ester carboxylesterase